MTAIPTRIVQGVVTRPDGTPWAGKTVTAKLNTVAFINDGTASPSLTTEIIREAYAVTNAAGLYVFKKLSVNASITQPTGTSYTLKVAGDNTILTIQVPAGDTDTPVWVFDCLVSDPTNPNNIVAGFPVPSGTAEVGDVPVVTQADPLEVEWGAGGGGGAVTSVDGHTGAVVLSGTYVPLDADPVVAGSGASATAAGQVAIGQGATASDTDAVAIGQAASATGPFSTAVGQESEADGHGSVGINGTALGYGTVAIGANSTAGTVAGAGTTYGVAVGASSTASGDSSVAVGLGATAAGTEAIAIGDGTSASADGSAAFGVDHTGGAASTSTQDEIKLGTALHTVNIPGAAQLAGNPVGGIDDTGTSSSKVWSSSKTAAVAALKADLVAGTVPRAQLPNITSVFTQSVSSQAAMLALTQPDADTSLQVIRTDVPGEVYWLNPGLSPATLGNWIAITDDATGAASAAQAFAIQRANHTGTQVMATISDAGNAATKNVGTTAGTVAAGDDSRIVNAAPKLTRSARTGNFTAALGEIEALDTSGGTFTATIPVASGGKGRIVLKWIAGALPPTLALSGADHFNTSTGGTSTAPVMQNESLQLESDGSSIWTLTADDAPASLLALTLVYARNTWS